MKKLLSLEHATRAVGIASLALAQCAIGANNRCETTQTEASAYPLVPGVAAILPHYSKPVSRMSSPAAQEPVRAYLSSRNGRDGIEKRHRRFSSGNMRSGEDVRKLQPHPALGETAVTEPLAAKPQQP